MQKPYLIVITGRPGSGKTTLAEKISRLWYLPLVSRDRIKEGQVHTFGKGHDDMPENANLTATEAFFDTLAFMLDRGVSVVAEAAFQHTVWERFLKPLSEKAQVITVVCRVDGQLALDRFLSRGMNDEKREYFHGDAGVRMLKTGAMPEVSAYNEPKLPYRTLYIDTTNGYEPDIDTLFRLVFNTDL